MLVSLVHNTPLGVAAIAIRNCYDSTAQTDTITPFYSDVLGPKDEELIRMVIKKDHTSTLEHIQYTFFIDGISRGCLQELARHRIASLSVQSTRYCLRKLIDETVDVNDLLVSTGDGRLDYSNSMQMRSIQLSLRQGAKNDVAKLALPEAFKTSLMWSINARSLRNFLKLRTSKRAHPEISELAITIYNVLPLTHDVLYEDIMKERENGE